MDEDARYCSTCGGRNYSDGNQCHVCEQKALSGQKSGGSNKGSNSNSSSSGVDTVVMNAAGATGSLQIKLQSIQMPKGKKKMSVTFASMASQDLVWKACFEACQTIRALKLKINTVTELFSLETTPGCLGQAIANGTISLKEVGELYGAIIQLCTNLETLLDQQLPLLHGMGILETLKFWAASGKGCITSLAEDLMR